MEMLQRMTTLLHTLDVPLVVEVPPAAEAPLATEVLPAIEILPSETIQTHKMTSTSRHSIPDNWESILNKKFEAAIARRKRRGRSISIKEDPFTKDVMNVHLPLKFKEPTGDFDGTTNPINHIRTFQDRVRLHGWLGAIA
ncbi:hypothetical protein Fot_19295 [Forsythia ovata]|uniref:Reverse transcriptase domain-containing protein n=1 Tax=Forsythia ovata TaxID=205694 RepID=A0ABD1VKM8_9LAMI